MSVREKVLKVLAEDSCAEPEQLRDHTKLKELRMDSLDTLEFVMNLEEELEISVADDEITVDSTVAQIVELCEKKEQKTAA